MVICREKEPKNRQLLVVRYGLREDDIEGTWMER